MLDAYAISRMQDEAARRAARERLHPLPLWSESDLTDLPFLGTYCPRGWRRLHWSDVAYDRNAHGCYGDRDVLLFVDASGWGADDEPALTLARAWQTIRAIEASARRRNGHVPNIGWAIYEAGEFQVHIAAYVKREAQEVAA